MKLFGAIAERAGTDELELEATSVSALRDRLHDRIPGMKDLIYAIAVDRRIDHDDRPLHGDEEIAILPPFAGG